MQKVRTNQAISRLQGDLEAQFEAFVDHYNHQRYHESLNNVTPADALRAANGKFQRRFDGGEDLLAERGKTPSERDLTEMDALWDKVKTVEKEKSLQKKRRTSRQ